MIWECTRIRDKHSDKKWDHPMMTDFLVKGTGTNETMNVKSKKQLQTATTGRKKSKFRKIIRIAFKVDPRAEKRRVESDCNPVPIVFSSSSFFLSLPNFSVMFSVLSEDVSLLCLLLSLPIIQNNFIFSESERRFARIRIASADGE